MAHKETDLKLVAALLSNTSVRAAAQSAGVSTDTLFRRLREPSFSGILKEQRLRTYGVALARLQTAAEEAVSTLVAVMRDETASEPARVKAAVAVLELAASSTQPEAVDLRLMSPHERMLSDLL